MYSLHQNIYGVFICWLNTIHYRSTLFHSHWFTSTKLSHTLVQFHSFILLKQVLNTSNTTTFNPWKQSIRPEKLIWLIDTWIISVFVTLWNFNSLTWLKAFWGCLWEIKQVFMSCKIIGTFSKQPNHI
jgi:hypothetical protein